MDDIKIEYNSDFECGSDVSREALEHSKRPFEDDTFYRHLPEESTEHRSVALCLICLPRIVKIKGYKNSSSNFISHMKHRHGETVSAKFRNSKAFKRLKFATSVTTPNNTIEYREESITQQVFDDHVAKFVVHSMMPLNIIENPHFISIFDYLNISQKGLRMIDRKTLENRIDYLYEDQKDEIKSTLFNTSFVCITSDVVSEQNWNFLLLTVHWINEHFMRKSAAIACRKFAINQSFDEITNELDVIISDFNINNKMIATLTKINNRKEFDLPKNLISKIDTLLPIKYNCCIQTLDICVTTDINEVLNTTLHNQILNKCHLFWKAAGTSQTASVVRSILAQPLRVPTKAKWHYLNDSLRQLVESKEKIKQLSKMLHVKDQLHANDFQYLEEYLECTKPIVEAFNVLQTQNNTFYGVVLPCLIAIRRKLRLINKDKLVHCQKLFEAIFNAIEKRFEEYFNVTTPTAQCAAIAAFSYPRFKNRWIHCIDVSKHENLTSLFKIAVSEEMDNTENISCKEDNNFNDSFFDFGNDNLSSNGIMSKVEAEILNYFNDNEQELGVLLRYPEIKNVFFKYNTPLASSLAVENMISFATIITDLPQSSLSDAKAEKRILLMANSQ